ncbi:hypothetical protein SDRG_06962 [Saprolegnia diclina VS20]|uniref:Integral membrane protein n=1 Tax=Saprolegnia diclina (strain VS20) TaxID=1156394 RepID=T0QLS7_SAPDV|nr:hypothetical protein SDRG_06962 [Saprolegnia diclina VS20]EQC35681.1 hypothetical protein SDRG_06962 [Saprolegnia diclina VS20]|eukprot:XP_008610998.1 hypothetical protein SDRG_06962 [Saprolegnia diclina VS20]
MSLRARHVPGSPLITTPPIQKVDLARDLAAARSAYKRQDVSASRAAHTNCVCEPSGAKAINEPGHSVNSMKNSVLKIGAESGITALGCNLLFLTALTAATNDAPTQRLLGPALAFAVAVALFAGVLAYRRTEEERFEYERERRREMWELDNFPEGEKEEMVQLYAAKGMSVHDATVVIDLMSKYEHFFVDIMMIEELSLLPPSTVVSSRFVGLMTCAGGLALGLAPLLLLHLSHSLLYLHRVFSAWGVMTTLVATSAALLRVYTFTGAEHTKTYSCGRLQVQLPYAIETFAGTFAAMGGAACVAAAICRITS